MKSGGSSAQPQLRATGSPTVTGSAARETSVKTMPLVTDQRVLSASSSGRSFSGRAVPPRPLPGRPPFLPHGESPKISPTPTTTHQAAATSPTAGDITASSGAPSLRPPGTH